jgi:phosphoglycerol transferase MdoB-like AlkP superfamily enzyme
MLRISKYFFLLNVSMILIYQIIFTLSYLHPKIWSLNETILLCLHSLRFNLSISTLLLSPPVLLGLLSIFFWKKKLSLISKVYIYLIFFVNTNILIFDYFSYPHTGTHIASDFFIYMKEFSLLFQTFLKSHTLITTAYCILVLLFLYFAIKNLISKTIIKTYDLKKTTYSLIIALSVLIARGGWTRVPIRVNDSIISNNNEINLAVLNPVFSVYHSILLKNKKDIMTFESSFKTVENFQKNGLSSPTPKNKLLYKTAQDKKFNIVFFLLESWSKKYVYQSKIKEVTPFFNSIKNKGHEFVNFYANGFRSSTGVFCSISCFPDLPGLSLIRRYAPHNISSSLSRELSSRNYTPFFVHGGDLDYDNVQNFLIKEKFTQLYGRKYFQKDNLKTKGSIWGVDDHSVNNKMLQLIDNFSKENKSFFALNFTSSTHAPYEVPSLKDFKAYPLKSHKEYKYLNSLHFADQALEKFFNQASKRPWFDQTIFIFTADHTHHTDLTSHEQIQIPFLIYSPKNIIPQKIKAIGSQMDIAPTLLYLMGHKPSNCLGRNLYSIKDEQGFAYSITNEGYTWVENGTGTTTSIGGKNYSTFTSNENKQSKNKSANSSSHITNAHALYQYTKSKTENKKLNQDKFALKKSIN